jgi:hypothetical protein
MDLLNTWEPLAWALAQTFRKLQELDPDPAGATEEHAACNCSRPCVVQT